MYIYIYVYMCVFVCVYALKNYLCIFHLKVYLRYLMLRPYLESETIILALFGTLAVVTAVLWHACLACLPSCVTQLPPPTVPPYLIKLNKG